MAIFTDEELRLFDGYVQGTLQPLERLELEKQLSSNKEVSNRFDFYRSIVQQIQEDSANHTKLKERFQRLESKQKHSGWLWLFAIAASIIGVVLFIFLFQKAKQIEQTGLAQFKVQEPGLPIVMAGETDSWTPIMQFYKQEKYHEALQAVQLKPKSDTSLYFAGLFKELSGDDRGATNVYRQLTNDYKTSFFASKALYRFAILLWGKGQKIDATALLRSIASDSSHIYQQQAQKVLRQVTAK